MKFLIKLLVKTALVIIAGLLLLVYTEKNFTDHLKAALGLIKKGAGMLRHPLKALSRAIEKL